MGNVPSVDEISEKLSRSWKKVAPKQKQWGVGDGPLHSNAAHKIASTLSSKKSSATFSTSPTWSQQRFDQFEDEQSASLPTNGRHKAKREAPPRRAAESAQRHSAMDKCHQCGRIDCLTDRSPFDVCRFPNHKNKSNTKVDYGTTDGEK